MKRSLKYFLNFLLLLAITTLLAEIVLGFYFSYKDRSIEALPVKDYPYLYFLFRDEGDLNEHGFKTQYPVKKPEGKYRVIIIGGSLVRGNNPDQSIAAYLEKELNENLQTKKVEVVNAGISAFVAEQEFLLTQLILQQYEPDMIVSLNGYNDLMTYKFNRMYAPDFPLPPHNWKDFRVIKDNRFKSKPYSRFAYFFKNINRVKEYFIRNRFERRFKWEEVKQEELNEISQAYWNVIDDTYDFCRAKEISYFNFLQPIQYYSKKQNGEKLPPAKETLFRLYEKMEAEIPRHPYAFSLTSILDERIDWFTDECHVTAEGNNLIAHAIFLTIRDSISHEISPIEIIP